MIFKEKQLKRRFLGRFYVRPTQAHLSKFAKKKTMIQFNKKKKQVFKKVCLCVFKLLIKYFGKELLDYIVQLLL